MEAVTGAEWGKSLFNALISPCKRADASSTVPAIQRRGNNSVFVVQQGGADKPFVLMRGCGGMCIDWDSCLIARMLKKPLLCCERTDAREG